MANQSNTSKMLERLKGDLYELLDILPDADEKAIKKAYRKKALTCHPDKNKDDPKAKEQFQQLSDAYQVLSDADAKSAYDNVLKAKKAAALRDKKLDAKRQKLKSDLEAREKHLREISLMKTRNGSRKMKRRNLRLKLRGNGCQRGGKRSKTSNFSNPQTLPKWSKRMYKNVDHFQSIYVFVFLLVLFLYCLITSPLLLIVLAASGGTCYILNIKQRERKLVISGKEISLPQQYAAVGVCSIPLFVLAGAGSAVFWVIGASFFFIGLHATFYNYEALDLTAEDQQSLTGSIVEDV